MGKGGFGKGKGGGGKSWAPLGPPDWVEEIGEASHVTEDQLIVKVKHARVPKFAKRIFLENKQEIGTLDEIFGPINDYNLSIKMAEGMKAGSFKPGQKLFIDPQDTLPFEMFLPQAPKKGAAKGGKGKGKGKDGGKGKGKGKGKDGGKGKGKGVSKGGAKGGAFTGRGGAR